MSEALNSTEHLVIKKRTSMVRASILINRSFSLKKQRSFKSKLFQQNEENLKQDDLLVIPRNGHIENKKIIILIYLTNTMNQYIIMKNTLVRKYFLPN